MAMRRAALWLGAACLAALAAGSASGKEPIATRGRLAEVTVYRGQALVAREVALETGTGLQEVVVEDLPEHVIAESIYAESIGDLEVRSVRYRTRSVAYDVRDKVRELDLAIRGLETELATVERRRQLIEKNRDYLGKLEAFSAPTAMTELKAGVLDVERLKRLTEFLFEQRARLLDEDLELQRLSESKREELELRLRQRREFAGRSSRTAREAVVFVNVLKEGGAALRLRYLVDNANWSPSYNFRALSTAGDRVLVEYNALIHQMSGEDWTDVRMTLSTATPNLAAKAPELAALPITLTARGRAPQQQGQGYWSQRQSLATQMRQAESARGLQRKGKLEADLDQALNRMANQMQVLDLVAPGEVQRGQPEEEESAGASEGISVTYQLSGLTTLPSRSDQQLIQISAHPMRAAFYKLAVPVLTPYVYNEASVLNSGAMVLLAGPASAYLDGEYMGNCDLPTVAIGERFTIGFGIDADLRSRRELVERTEDIQGGNRVLEFTYRLGVENFSGESATVRLLERIPDASGSEVKVTLGEVSAPLADDAEYLQNERKQGILRWDMDAPAQTSGAKAASVTYSFALEYDKQYTVGALEE